MNRKYLLVFVALLALFAAACGDDSETTAALESEVSSLQPSGADSAILTPT